MSRASVAIAKRAKAVDRVAVIEWLAERPGRIIQDEGPEPRSRLLAP